MRVTTKMINNSMMANIAKNKDNLDKLNNQYTTGNKIQKPSDDPIVAVRTLKLRKTMSEIKQYTEKNIPDAMSWMDVTTSSLDSMNDIMTSIYGYLNQGATDILSASERKTIAQNLLELKNEIYSEGNANYAGRYVFTGYKTDTPLTFQENCDEYKYTITEHFDIADIDEVSKLKGAYEVKDYEAATPDASKFKETPVETIVHKIQIGYNNLCSEKTDEKGNQLPIAADFSATGLDGNLKSFKEIGITVVQRSAYDKNAYDIDVPLKDKDGNYLNADGIVDNTLTPDTGVKNYAIFIPETGELVLSDGAHNILRNQTKGITAVYDKESFDANDVRPEHYYSCVAVEKGITNKDEAKTVYIYEEQDIKYEINFGQKMKVNTQMSEAVGNDFARTIDNLVAIVNEVNDLESQIGDVDSFLSNQNISKDQKEALTALKTQLETQLTIKNKMMTQTFEQTLDKVKGYQSKLNTANANLGSRYSRLEMVGDRLESQYSEYEELLSENIDVDLVETYINLTSADTVYNASLQTAAKIAQNSLLDFIR